VLTNTSISGFSVLMFRVEEDAVGGTMSVMLRLAGLVFSNLGTAGTHMELGVTTCNKGSFLWLILAGHRVGPVRLPARAAAQAARGRAWFSKKARIL